MSNKLRSSLKFTVASALLRELGERLVGSPALAVGELIKNAYDADATEVSIRFEGNSLIVEDNGHGMTFDQFKSFWMRIGTPHKQSIKNSPKYERPLTGSKGVGRLSVQYLGSYLELSTTSKVDGKELVAIVDWTEAVDVGDMQEAKALYELRDTPGTYLGSKTGFSLKIENLLHGWDEEADFEQLARDIWKLSPPLGGRSEKQSGKFSVDLEGVSKGASEKFLSVMLALNEIWHAKITGTLVKRKENDPMGSSRVKIQCTIKGGKNSSHEIVVENCNLEKMDYEIRVFDLIGRQPKGLRVGEVRQYLDDHGGVRIFDAGFGLSHYGLKTDWLEVERDHSHRLSRSKLLPKRLQISEGMNNLPTQDRIMGEVNIDSKVEQKRSRKGGDPGQKLSIAVTRDRLLENNAFKGLARAVRTGLDLYAMEQTKQKIEKVEIEVQEYRATPETFSRVEKTLDTLEKEIPDRAFKVLKKQIGFAHKAEKAERKVFLEERGLMGALATAGISAIAFEHEAVKQYKSLASIARKLRNSKGTNQELLKSVSNEIDSWIKHAQQTRAIFAPYMDPENLQDRVPMNAKKLVERTISQSQVYLGGIEFNLSGITKNLQLPDGTLAEWTAIFQNIIVNAANAMSHIDRRVIDISSLDVEDGIEFYIQDTGQGVDLRTSEDLFKPFVRKLKIEQQRLALGAGGTGMGLTIVKMLADGLDVEVSFEEPDEEFATCFTLSWSA